MIEAIRKSVTQVRDRIDRAWQQGANAAEKRPRLMAVTKTRPIEALSSALDAGVDCLGENRVQELRGKQKDFGHGWPGSHMELIGPLQTNKAKYLPELVCRVQSLDRGKLAAALEMVYSARDQVLPVLIQVNIDAEPQKSGFLLHQVSDFLSDFDRWPHLVCQGLMAIPKHQDDPEQVRPRFHELAERMTEFKLRDWPENVNLTELSMGMSADFEVAVEEGSTLVRVGTSLFGPRQ